MVRSIRIFPAQPSSCRLGVLRSAPLVNSHRKYNRLNRSPQILYDRLDDDPQNPPRSHTHDPQNPPRSHTFVHMSVMRLIKVNQIKTNGLGHGTKSGKSGY